MWIKPKLISYSLKTVAYSLCAVGCFYQLVSILNLYLAFPTTVFSFVEIMDTLKIPAITLCTNNRVMLDKLKQFDPTFQEAWNKINEDRINANRTKMLKQILIDRTIRKLMDNLPVYEFHQLGHQWDDILANNYFKCATDPFNLDKKCINYSNPIKSVQDVGNCFTVFRRSNNQVLDRIAIRSGISQSPVIRGVEDALNLEMADQPFHPNEIFRIMINFSVDERTALNEKTMGMIAIHDTNELASIRSEKFIIYPGNYYEFYVSKETGKYLPSPYITDCTDYEPLFTTSEDDRNNSYKQVLSKNTCIMDCMARHCIENCQCWPPELPFVVDNSSDHLKWCSWRDGANVMMIAANKSKTVNLFRFCFANHEKTCKQQCKISCKVDTYEVIRQSIVWPSKERIEHSKKYDMSYRKCCSLVSIRFWSPEQLIQEYQPKYEFVEFISYFGGLLSIWLGFSLVKTYDVGEIAVRKSITYLLQYRQRFRTNHQLENRLWADTDQRVRIRPRVSRYSKTNE